MTGQIHILGYTSCKVLITELAEKLRRGGRDFLTTFLSSEKVFSPSNLLSNVSMNVLIVSQEDIPALKSVKRDSFPQLKTIRKGNSLSVAFCINCPEKPLFLYDCFMIKDVGNSAEDIRREIVQIHNQVFQNSKGRYGYFVGRNNEIEQFQNLLYSDRASRINTLVVSGRIGVGREAYVRECIRQGKGLGDYEPFLMSMGNNGNIELFLIQLNSFHHLYSEVEFKKVLRSGTEEKVNAAVKMLNELFYDDNYLIIYDDGASCVRYNRGLSDWFRSVVTHPLLKGGIHLYVISNISVSYSRIKTDDEVAFITLYGLTLSDRKKLLYKRMSELMLSLTEEKVSFLAENLVYSPSQLFKVIEDIKVNDIKNIKDVISSYQIVGDKKILPLVNSYSTSDHPEAINILVLLSRIEYVNNKILYSIFEDKKVVDEEIDRFLSDGIVERFGEWMDLIRLDSSISDYFRRNRVDYTDKNLKALVIDKLDELLDNTLRITEDYATYLFKLKKRVQRGTIDSESFLVPSVLLNTIAESYEVGNWEQAITLCENVIEAHPEYFEEVYFEINYWYCLALARTQNFDKFYRTVKNFYGADIHFLKGFFLRIGKQYSKAEEEYRKALKINPSFPRVKREMVIVLQAQHKFKDAFEMAELNYEKDPENSYHIYAYFRCLVRKNGITSDDRKLLSQFIEDNDNLFKSKKYFTDGMNFEYKRFIDRAKPEELLPLAAELANRYKDVAYIKDITDDYYVSQGLKSHLIPIDFSNDFSNDFSTDFSN